MTTCSTYDFEINRDLMPKIRQLTDPPASTERPGKYKGNRKIRGKSTQQQNSKSATNGQPSNGGKWFNHEFCDYCREGGDVLCCDRCPATFHLKCNEPPLDEEEIPEGAYYCRSCLAVLKKAEEELERAKELDSTMEETEPQRSEEPSTAIECSLPNGKAVKPKTEGGNLIRIDYVKSPEESSIAETTAPEPMNYEDEDSTSLDKNGNRVETEEQHAHSPSSLSQSSSCQHESLWSHNNPLSLLIEAAQALNPQQFDLPPDYISSIPLPGAPKKPLTYTSRKKLPHELDNNGLVPFPLKTCFQCRQSCKKAPLIQCDFCPLLYHADCLDPPLTALPATTSKWICPAHSEHIIDQKLLTSTRLTERVRLWNRFNGRLDENAVKISFLDKIHTETSNDSTEAYTEPPEKRIRVPESIKNMYRNPAQLLDTASKEFETTDPELCRALRRQQLLDNQIQPPSTSDQEAYLSGILALMQSSIAQYMTKANADRSLADENARDKVNKSIHSWMEDVSYLWKKVDDEDSQEADKKADQTDLIAQSLSKIESKFASTAISPNDLDETLIEKLDIKFIKTLALQRLRQLVPAKKTEDSDVTAMAGCSTLVTRRFLNGEIKARALLCPVKSITATVKSATEPCSYPMRYRSLTIGLGDSNDLVLSNYGHCNFLSAAHAAIYFDESTQCYELINYSEHGTLVDNILYSLDFSSDLPAEEVSTSRKLPPPSSPSKMSVPALKKKGLKRKKSRLTKPPKKMNKKTNPVSNQPDNKSERTMCAGGSAAKPKDFKECDCQCSASVVLLGSGAGWEGPAQLKHGAHIQFGCIQFVFGVTAFATSTMAEDGEEIASMTSADADTVASDVSTVEAMHNASIVVNPPKVEKMDKMDPQAS